MLLLMACTSTQTLVPPTVAEDPTLPRLTLADTTLHGQLLGDPADPLVVLLHGGPGMDQFGMARLGALSEHGFQVLIYDQRGAGLSERHDAGSVDAELHVQDLQDLIAAYSPDGQAVLIGHSWGGQLAVASAQAHPDTVSSLVLLDPGPFTDALFMTMGLTEIDMRSDHLNSLFWQEQMLTPDRHAHLDLNFAQLMSDQLPGYNFSPDDPMPFVRMGYQGYVDTIGAAQASGWDFREGLDTLPAPVHLIWGDDNEIMDADYRAEQAAPFSDPQVLTLEGVGHDAVWVAADAVVAHLLGVL
ncbi:MAG: alpha/beta hydrolase [Myxococcota bacterium]|nr:alpha/beta hydrolase [Myxococcota bacterium]